MTSFPGPDPLQNSYGSGRPPGGPPNSALSRVTGGLLALTGSLLLLALLLPLQIQTAPLLGDKFEVRTTAWQLRYTSENRVKSILNWLGLPLTLAALATLVTAVLLLAGLGARSRAVGSLGILSAALGSGVALTVVVGVIPPEVPGMVYEYGPGFWISAFAMVVAVVAAVTGLIADRSAPGPANRARDAATGGLLVLTGTTAITGSFLRMSAPGTIEFTTWGMKYLDQTMSSRQGLALVVSGAVALVVALLLLVGLASRTTRIHGLAIIAGGLSLATAVTVILDAWNDLTGDSLAIGDSGPGFWLLVLAALLSLAATAIALLANSATTPAPQFPGPAQQYPGQPQPYAGQPQPYAGQQQPYPGQPQPYPAQPQQYPGQAGPYPSQPQPYPHPGQP
ncbi:hypothetical protein JK358_26495 [Nocardia sp. 2]|uniref:Integral membrane protein n=1 Tax=Nocardia acididurans TaxID=2802282 RepID=A0ABS1MBD9_9NOCA|nr:hypothetical protein [Nocardia acididurans]MBL1077958.1 hypothetical protein [Nocardia acididurans]